MVHGRNAQWEELLKGSKGAMMNERRQFIRQLCPELRDKNGPNFQTAARLDGLFEKRSGMHHSGSEGEGDYRRILTEPRQILRQVLAWRTRSRKADETNLLGPIGLGLTEPFRKQTQNQLRRKPPVVEHVSHRLQPERRSQAIDFRANDACAQSVNQSKIDFKDGA